MLGLKVCSTTAQLNTELVSYGRLQLRIALKHLKAKTSIQLPSVGVEWRITIAAFAMETAELGKR